MVASLTGAHGRKVDAAHAARQILVATLHRCHNRIWRRAFPAANEEAPPAHIASLHLERPAEAARLLSPQAMAVILQKIIDIPLTIGLKDYRVSGPHPLAPSPFAQLKEPVVGYRMPIFAQFCKDLFEKLSVSKRHWFALFYFACSSYLHTGQQARAALSIFVDSIGHGDKLDLLLDWMREQDRILFGAENADKGWQENYVTEWKILAPYLRVSLPERHKRSEFNLATASATPGPAALAPVPAPATFSPVPPAALAPAPAPLPAAVSEPPRPPPRSASASPEAVATPTTSTQQQSKPEVVNEDELVAGKPQQEEATDNTADSAGEDSGAEEEEEDSAAEEEAPPEGGVAPATKPSKARLDLPPMERIARKCKRACCKKEHLEHDLLHDFVHQYGLDPKIRSDHAYRLVLIRLFGNSDKSRKQLVSGLYENPDSLISRINYRGQLCQIEKPACRSCHSWHGFLGAFDAVDKCNHSKLSLRGVDTFNNLVNRSACRPGESATATSLRIKRYLTVHYGGRSQWKELWRHAWGEPSEPVCRTVDAYLQKKKRPDASTLQRIVYLVPVPQD